MKRPARASEVQIAELRIADLVPGEPRLDRDAVAEYVTQLRSGEAVDPPHAIRFEQLYYIRDGNHRVMAHKLCGFTTIRCAVQEKRKATGISDFDEDSFRKFLASGLLGFENLDLVDRKDKEEGYEHEDNEMFEEALDRLNEDEAANVCDPVEMDISDDDLSSDPNELTCNRRSSART